MATAPTSIGPIRETRINQLLFVGEIAVRTINAAVAYAIDQGGSFLVIIPFGYTTSDPITGVVNGNANVMLCDERGTSPQLYVWVGGAGYVPAVFAQLGGFIATGETNTPLGCIALMFNPGGTSGNGSGNIIVAANPDTGRPAFNLQLMKEDGTIYTYIRCDEDPVSHLARTQMPTDVIITGALTAAVATIAGLLTAASAAITGALTAGSAVIEGSLSANDGIEVFGEADFIGAIVAQGNVSMTGNNTVLSMPNSDLAARNIGATGFARVGSLQVDGDMSADDAQFNTCEVEGSPVRTMANTPNAAGFPPAGVPQSTGSAWGTSINPATLVTNTGPNIFFGDQTIAGGDLIAQANLRMTGSNTVLNMANSDLVARNMGASGFVNITGSLTADSAGFNTCQVAGSLVRTMANTPNPAPFPPAGVPQSTGTAWGTSIPAASIARTDTTNNFTADQSFSGTLDLYPTAETPGAVGHSSIRTAEDFTLVMNPGNTNAPTLMNWERGNGGFYIGNGAATSVVGIDSFGNATFAGTITAAAKSFKVTDPLDDRVWLVHGCLEGPEYGVYYRGEDVTDGTGSVEIELPDYFDALTMSTNRTVLLTQIFEDDGDPFVQFMASRVTGNTFRVRSSTPAAKFYWEVKAIRNDIATLPVRISKETPTPPMGYPSMQPPNPPPQPNTPQQQGKRRKV